MEHTGNILNMFTPRLDSAEKVIVCFEHLNSLSFVTDGDSCAGFLRH